MNLLCGLLMCLSLSVSAFTDQDGAPPFLGQMKSGAYTRTGAAACPPSMRYGTVLWIPVPQGDDLTARNGRAAGLGGRAYVCMDRGPAITEGRADLWVGDPQGGERERAKLWGRQWLTVVVIR